MLSFRSGSIVWLSLLFHMLILALTSCAEGTGLSHGLGDHIEWKTYVDGIAESKRSNKPLCLIIHKTWCGACKAFKPKFAQSTEIEILSKNFVMVNTEDEEEPSNPEFQPDGSYIPRVLFLDPNGQVMVDVYNESGNVNYRYYYYDAEGVIGSMRKALEKVKAQHRQDEL